MLKMKSVCVYIYIYLYVGVRFRSSTNGCAMCSSEELKPRNIFYETVELLISLKKDIFEQHVLPRYLRGGGTGVVPAK